MDLMNILSWLVVGGLAGWVGSMIMKTDAQMGAVANIVVGVVGALIGGWVLNLVGTAPAAGQLNIMSILSAILGAVILLFVVKMFRARA